VFMFLCMLSPMRAQVSPIPFVLPQYFDSNGQPVSGGCLFTYESGTSTPLVTYVDAGGVTANTNPIILNAAGRPTYLTSQVEIFLSSAAYRFVLFTAGGSNCSTGTQLWLVDGITSNSLSLLSSSNVWTGSNTFNGPVTTNSTDTFNAGFTSNGPSNLAAGGTFTGTFGGNPTFSGVIFITGGMTFNVPWTSIVATGTAPFNVSSTTEVPNLDANYLQGATWAAPAGIGSTTPNTAAFTTLMVDTSMSTASFSFIGFAPTTFTQGSDTGLLTSGTFTGAAGVQICKDANGGATTVGCAGGGFSRISLGTSGSVCTTASSAGATCSTVVTISPTQADTSYIPSCMGISITGAPYIVGSTSLTTTSIAVQISNGQGSQAVPSTYGSLACSAIHP
jgi:hypothetical protein